MNPVLVIVVVVAVAVIALLIRAIRIVPQGTAGIVERFGRYHRTLSAGHNVVVPFVDRLRPLIDLREQVISFPPQPVTTADNLVVSTDTVMYYHVADARAATYAVANFITAVEQLTVTRLRDVIGGMPLDRALTSREEINGQIREVIDEKAKSWGLHVSHVELKSIDPPSSIQEAIEKEMHAERDKQAAISAAEGEKQSAIRSAEGEKQSAILRAQGDAEAQAVRAQGQSQAISALVETIRQENPDNRLLAYQYIQMLPQIAEGSSNKVWIVPSEMGKALEGLSSVFEAADGATEQSQTGQTGQPGQPGKQSRAKGDGPAAGS